LDSIWKGKYYWKENTIRSEEIVILSSRKKLSYDQVGRNCHARSSNGIINRCRQRKQFRPSEYLVFTTIYPTRISRMLRHATPANGHPECEDEVKHRMPSVAHIHHITSGVDVTNSAQPDDKPEDAADEEIADKLCLEFT
jgi:hypothetical protein